MIATRPALWWFIERRLRRRLSPETFPDIAGDLIEDYRRDRETRGAVRAEWRLWRDAASIARAYRDVHPRAERWSTVWSDARLALRQAGRERLLTAAVVLPLAFAVSTNTALFSIIDGLLFRPLPFRDTDALVSLQVSERSTAPRQMARYVALVHDVAASPLFSGVAFASGSTAFASSPDLVAELGLVPGSATAGYFTLLGVRLVAGRDLSPADLETAQPLAVVIGDDVWRRVWHGDPSVVGTVVSLAGRSVQVIGIAPAGVSHPAGVNLWVPAGEMVTRNSVRFWRLARLAPGVSIEQVRGRYPDLDVERLRTSIQPKGAEALVFLLGATGIFLLAAWVQIGALLLARATSRASEVGVRLALGAGRGRLVQQYLVENALLAATALACAWIVTPWLTMFIARQLPAAMTAGQQLVPDARTFVFAGVVSAIGAALLAVAPIELMRRASPLLLLREAGASTGVRTYRLRSALLVTQIACTALLLCVAGLALRSFAHVSRVDVGFKPEALWKFAMPSLPDGLSAEQRQAARAVRSALVNETMRAIGTLPGVTSVGAAAVAPLSATAFRADVTEPAAPDRAAIESKFNLVTPGLLRTIGARVASGRLPEASDTSTADSALVVNDTLARALAKNGPVLGRDVRFAGYRGRIVGVVDDLLDQAPGVPAEPQVFAPIGPGTANVLLIRSSTASDPTRGQLTSVLQGLWGPFGASRLSPVSEDVAKITAPWRARSILLGVVAVLCVPLAVTGITGALSYTVRMRSREIAIRMALGAEASRVGREVIGRALMLTSFGVAAGIAGGVATGRLMASQLFNVDPADALTVVSVIAGMLTMAWLASIMPARRAASIAPALALKEK